MKRALGLSALTVYLVAAIAGASYYSVAVRKLPKTEANLLIGLILTVLIGLPGGYVLWRSGTAPQRRRRAAQAETEARVAALSAVPGVEPFLPLLRKGYWMTEEELRRRISRANALLAVPHRAPFVSRIYEGFPITDEQIDYLALPDRFALCEHFRPLESALKQACLLTYRSPGFIEGNFRPDVGKLPLPLGIEQEYVERSSPREDDDHFVYRCRRCQHTLMANCSGPLWPT